MPGRVQFAYTAKPDDPDRPSLLARQDQVRAIADGMALACKLDEVPSDGPRPYLDLIVSVPDPKVVGWIEATHEHPPTSDVLCEHDLQALAISGLGLRTEVCLTEEPEEWEARHSVAALIAEVADALYGATESLEPISVDLAYLYPAIARGTTVEWYEPGTPADSEGDRHTDSVELFRHLFPPDHRVWRHIVTVPSEPTEPEAEGPTVRAGDPCPACGGTIVVDGTVSYTRVPICEDGTPTDEGQGGDFEWNDEPYCSECGQRVRVGW